MNNHTHRFERETGERLVDVPAYYVQNTSSEKPDDTLLVAIDVQVSEYAVEWFDSTKERRFVTQDIHKSENGSLEFTDKKGRSYHLTPLDLDLYNHAVRPRLFNSQLFETTEAMWDALLESKRNAR